MTKQAHFITKKLIIKMDDFNKTINIFKVTEKLKEIQQEIGLTDDEIILIAYSAAEHEHFDTLSVSSS